MFVNLAGTPKGAILTHDNLIWDTNAINAALQCFDEGHEVVVSYLPMVKKFSNDFRTLAKNCLKLFKYF
jgi:long-subunit acyl-CoA synthetase (AMP-forming)